MTAQESIAASGSAVSASPVAAVTIQVLRMAEQYILGKHKRAGLSIGRPSDRAFLILPGNLAQDCDGESSSAGAKGG
jgi:hypothetical protein